METGVPQYPSNRDGMRAALRLDLTLQYYGFRIKVAQSMFWKAVCSI
jgi:hypothetical protein